MKITVTSERPQNDQVAAQVTVAADDVKAAVKKAYRDIANKYAFQGFRRGHAPRPVIDGIVGRDYVLAEATNDLLNEVQPQMIEELDVVPVTQPDYGEDPDLVTEGEDYVVKATITVPPTCELDSYDAPAINMPPQEATEAEIDQQVEQLMSYHTTYEDDDTADRAIVEGDVITASVKNIEGAGYLEGEDRELHVDHNYLPDDLVEGIIGMKPGETKQISWTRTHDHDGETHEHKFSVEVTVKAIKKAIVPELDDAFAKKNFGFDTVAEFRDAVKEEIEEDKKQSLPNLKENRVVEEAGKHLTLDEVPEAYQNQVFNELAQEFLAQLQRQNITLDLYLRARGIKSQDFINDLHEQAEERARQSLALDAIANKLGFEATDEDVRKEFENAGVDDVDASIASFTAEGRMPAIRESIRRQKAANWLVDNAKVTVVDEIAEQRAKGDEDDSADDAATTSDEASADAE